MPPNLRVKRQLINKKGACVVPGRPTGAKLGKKKKKKKLIFELARLDREWECIHIRIKRRGDQPVDRGRGNVRSGEAMTPDLKNLQEKHSPKLNHN